MPPLNGASVLSGGTLTPSGGSAITFGTMGIQNNSNELFCTDDTDLRTRRTITCSVKAPKVSVSAPNGYTQARATALFKSPLALDNGNMTVNTVRIEFAYDPETTNAEVDELKIIAAQIINDSDFNDLFEDLSLA